MGTNAILDGLAHRGRRRIAAYLKRGAQAMTRGAAAALCGLVLACSPTWNWREIRAEDQGWAAALPDKPSRMERRIDLEGMPVTMSMQAVQVEGATFLVAMVQLPDDQARTREQAVAALVRGRLQAIRGAETGRREVPFPISGSALQVILQGSVASGDARLEVTEHLGITTYGARLWQWSVIGAEVPPDQVRTFLEGFRLTAPPS